ncbi:MAG: hypothetical protein R3C26_16405 [Calditrichia bacterium]
MKTGARLKLDFSTTSPDKFLQKRLNYHMGLIQKYFQNSTRVELIQHTIQPEIICGISPAKNISFP